MPVALQDVMARLSPEDRAEVERGAAEIVTANRTLRELRKSLNVTQSELASALATSQANVAQIEGKNDLMVSTVIRVVEALGGTMQMVIQLPGRPATTLTVGRSNTADAKGPRAEVRRRA